MAALFFPLTLQPVPANSCVLSLFFCCYFLKILQQAFYSLLHRTIQTCYYGYTGEGDTFWSKLHKDILILEVMKEVFLLIASYSCICLWAVPFPVCVKVGSAPPTITHRWLLCDGSARSTSFPLQGGRKHAASTDCSRIPECPACQKQHRKCWQVVQMVLLYVVPYQHLNRHHGFS